MALIYNASFDSQTRVLSLLDKAGNVISSCEVPSKSNVDDITKPLTFKATQDGSTVKLTKYSSPYGVFQTSSDGGNTWVDYTINTTITLNIGDEVSFRAKTNRTSAQTYNAYFYFIMTGKIEAWNNVMSLYRTNDFATYESVVDYAFYKLFEDCTSLAKVPALPATTLATSCYECLFYGCSALTQAPELPATHLAQKCYAWMFRGCSALTQAPELPATHLAQKCYDCLFYGCSALTQAPELPVTTLTEQCYQNMFCMCTSLTQAPSLPATTLAEACYRDMFRGCTSLTSAPQLPATTLADYCYGSMFSRCSNLKEVRIAATTTATQALYSWLEYVSATGDFYCDPNATIFPKDSASGIPKGWNRRDINPIKALTLTATADNSSVKLTKIGTLDNTFEVDTGNGWTAYEFDTVIPLNAGQSCKWRCSAHPTTQSDSNYVRFFMTGTIEASGNCNSMLSSDFENLTSLSGYDYAFRVLFYGCTSLTRAPSLPATTMAKSCYAAMFYGCKALTRAPSLPATTLANSCYASMFYGCKALTRAPSLPATTLAEDCYSYMFSDCSKLKEVHIAATTTATLALGAWLSGVSPTGDFYCDPNATIFPTNSASGIPQNWTRHALSDYPATP